MAIFHSYVKLPEGVLLRNFCCIILTVGFAMLKPPPRFVAVEEKASEPWRGLGAIMWVDPMKPAFSHILGLM